jgi:hypothetical protein
VQTVLQVPAVLVLVVFQYRRERATPSRGFILSPSATLRVAGLGRRVKVEHPTV